ncbi:MAG: hemerythrin family protein [Chlorobi bacterium]|nr:hemerythrin family protein [Chlorobiota bacterium]
MYLDWEQKYETGIAKIDKQHKQLFDIINKLHKNVIIEKDGSLVNELLLELKIFTIDHFSTEERVFKKYNYPQEAYHIKSHQNFTKMVSDNLFDVTSTRLVQGYKILDFLKEWLPGHIIEHDMEYVSFLKKQTGILADIKNDIIF